MSRPVRKAVFPVAGLGTRFLPATKVVPKELLPVANKPLIQWAVEEAYASGIKEFCFVISPGKAAVEEHFRPAPRLEQALQSKGKADLLDTLRTLNEFGVFVSVDQPEPLGLGHAVWCARDFVGDEPFAVLLPDDLILADTPCLRQMTAAYDTTGGNMAAVVEVAREKTAQYGVLDVEEEQGVLVRARGLVEKPDPAVAPSTLSIIGRYILDPGVMELLSHGKAGAGQEIQLTDAIAEMIPKTPFNGYRFSGRRFDCGQTVGFVAANLACALNDDLLREPLRAACSELL